MSNELTGKKHLRSLNRIALAHKCRQCNKYYYWNSTREMSPFCSDKCRDDRAKLKERAWRKTDKGRRSSRRHQLKSMAMKRPDYYIMKAEDFLWLSDKMGWKLHNARV